MEELDTLVDDFEKACNKLSQYQIEIGVFSSKNKRKKTKKSKNGRKVIVKSKNERKETVRVGVTNAELMFIHEYGSPAQHIPARPVLQMTIDYANENLLNKAIDKALAAYFESNFDEKEYEKQLERLCVKMENYARKIIYDNDGRLAPNSPRVTAAKGGNHPLFNTGQLARSITCRLVKI